MIDESKVFPVPAGYSILFCGGEFDSHFADEAWIWLGADPDRPKKLLATFGDLSELNDFIANMNP